MNSIGVPLEIILQELKTRNMVIDWLNFFEETRKHNWNPKTTLSKIEASIGDVYGREVKEEIVEKLKLIYPVLV